MPRKERNKKLDQARRILAALHAGTPTAIPDGERKLKTIRSYMDDAEERLHRIVHRLPRTFDNPAEARETIRETGKVYKRLREIFEEVYGVNTRTYMLTLEEWEGFFYPAPPPDESLEAMKKQLFDLETKSDDLLSAIDRLKEIIKPKTGH